MSTNLTKNEQRAAARRAAAERAEEQRSAAAKRRQLMMIGGVVAAVVLIVGLTALITSGVGPFKKSGTSSAHTVSAADVGKKAPEVTAGEGDVTALKIDTLVKGTGPVVKKGDTISVHYTGVTYKDGKKFDSSWDKGQPVDFPIGVGQVIPGWDEGLVGVTVGSRVQLDIPADKAYGEQAQAGRPAGDLRFVVDVLSAKAAQSAETPKFDKKDAPTVTKGTGEVKELKVMTLKEGTGAAVKKGQTISVMYTGVTYVDGKQFDSSWDRGQPFETPIGVGQVIPGWDEGLVGVKIGSRVQLDIPSAKAYGDAGANGSPKGALRFVVDIISAK